MKPYKIINDSMLNMLSHIEENSIDCVITDPPYELGFMGKSWDSSGIAFNPETWKKCLKVLKPGGYLLAFGGSRTFHRIACAIEDAGFELRDTIMYLYGSGFPKSLDISKAIDKRNGNSVAWFGKWLREWREENGIKQSEVSALFPSKSGGKTGCVANWELGLNMPTAEQFSKIVTHFKLPFETIEEAKREVVGSKMSGIANKSEKSRHTIGASKAVKVDITAPSTNLAKQWQGYGTALKPAFEPIIMARKPIKTTVAENVMIYGVGGINIDECRVGDEERFLTPATPKKGTFNCSFDSNYDGKNVLGRFPANIIHDGSEEVIECMGEASRYFYTAKASKKDRDEGLDTLEAVEIRGGDVKTSRKNTHPTVKPCELMQYLIRLVAPKGATILDPFMGSGSTGKAVMFENRERNADYKFIGIDLEKQYCEIAETRIDYALNKYEYDFKQELQESKEKGQLNLFDMEENI